MKNNSIYADLHVHSSASDGTYSPEELVQKSVKEGLPVLAITDHDTISGVKRARIQAENEECEVVAGIELSCGWEGREASIHVLGLFIDDTSPELLALLERQKNFRYLRALKILELLTSQGLDMSDLKHEFETNREKVLGRPHVARYLLEKGYTNNFQQAFGQYLGRGCPAYVPKDHVDPESGIEIIKKAGGIAILAHPGLIPDWEPVWEKIKDMPWDGFETYYSEHSNSQVKKFEAIVGEKKWISTGGSDFHGDYGKHRNRLGKYGLNRYQYESLIEWYKNREG
ncbi:MAG: PHP domain-containing protein [Candidatus Rifleibacteriota bacterium]